MFTCQTGCLGHRQKMAKFWNPLLEWSTYDHTIRYILSAKYDKTSLGVVIVVPNFKPRYGALVRLSFEPQAGETMKTMTGTLGEVHFGVSMMSSKQRWAMVDLPVSWRKQNTLVHCGFHTFAEDCVVAILKLLLKSWIDHLVQENPRQIVMNHFVKVGKVLFSLVKDTWNY